MQCNLWWRQKDTSSNYHMPAEHGGYHPSNGTTPCNINRLSELINKCQFSLYILTLLKSFKSTRLVLYFPLLMNYLSLTCLFRV